MKVLLVGDYYWEIYAKAFYDAFIYKNINVIKFDTSQYFKNKPNLVGTGKKKREVSDLYYLFQCKFNMGPVIKKMNAELKRMVEDEKPDLVFLYRDRFIRPSILKYIKSKNIKIFAYNNDNPFSLDYPKYFWNNYFRGIKYCDHVFAYRESNISDYKRIGVNNSSILRSYYLKEKNYYVDGLPLSNQYDSDVTFIGHFENDNRDEYLKELFERGYKVKLYGSGWNKSKYYDFFCKKNGEIKSLKEDYNLAINSTKIALVFLSKINGDTYTRRCFEIPATKTFMFSEYTDDLDNMFKEGKEAEYFRNKNEFIRKIDFYLNNNNKRNYIAENGYKRLIIDGHEVSDRINEIVTMFECYVNK